MPGQTPRRCFCDQDFERLFDEEQAEDDLDEWRRLGPPEATQELIEVLRVEGVEGAALLDIGAGVGIVHLELLEAGAATAVDVDASTAYLATAHAEAERRGLGDRVEHRYGDVVELAAALPPSDVVTLDRVICCYPDLPTLLRAALMTGPRLIGLVHPNDAWWSRASAAAFNIIDRVLRRHHSFYVHRRTTIDSLLGRSGFAPRHRGGSRYWKVSVYARSEA